MSEQLVVRPGRCSSSDDRTRSILALVSQLALRRFARVGRMLLAAVVCVAGLAVMSKLVGSSTFPLTPGRGHLCRRSHCADGSLVEKLPLAPNIGVQMATSFVGVAAPGGGLALTARFLQKRGVDTPTAVAAIGVDSIAGFIIHLTLTGLFVALAGSSGLETFDLPSLLTIGLITAGVGVVACISVAIPWSRSLLTTRVLPATKRSLANVGDIARQPSKMMELFGGSVAITMGYILALEVAVAAFGAGPAFTSVALVYLVGSAVSSVAPTPGGIGAVEATLIAGLTSAGMSSTTAVAAVILFRLATFWIPLLPGWGALVVLQRSGDV